MTDSELQARLDVVAALTDEQRQVLLGCLVTIVAADQWKQALESALRVEHEARVSGPKG